MKLYKKIDLFLEGGGYLASTQQAKSLRAAREAFVRSFPQYKVSDIWACYAH